MNGTSVPIRSVTKKKHQPNNDFSYQLNKIESDSAPKCGETVVAVNTGDWPLGAGEFF